MLLCFMGFFLLLRLRTGDLASPARIPVLFIYEDSILGKAVVIKLYLS